MNASSIQGYEVWMSDFYLSLGGKALIKDTTCYMDRWMEDQWPYKDSRGTLLLACLAAVKFNFHLALTYTLNTSRKQLTTSYPEFLHLHFANPGFHLVTHEYLLYILPGLAITSPFTSSNSIVPSTTEILKSTADHTIEPESLVSSRIHVEVYPTYCIR